MLTLRALGLGDLLTAVPALRALGRAFPMHYRVLAAPIRLAPLVRLCAAFDEVVDAEPLQPLDVQLRDLDVAVNLHGRGPESDRVLLPLRPKRLIAFRNDAIAETAGSPVWRADEHEVARWCRLLRESGIPADENDIAISVPRHDVRALGAIAVHPGAACESRRWPMERWIEVCTRLHAAGHRLVFTGSAAEFRRCRHIAKAAGLPVESVLAGTTGVEALACIIASARALICTDTGVAHVATAVGTPSVVMFGPVSPAHWGPPRRSRHRVLWRGIPGDPHAEVVDPGLASITPDEVLAEVDALLHLPQAG